MVVRWDSISLLYANNILIHHYMIFTTIYGWSLKQIYIKLRNVHLIDRNVKIYEFIILMLVMHILLIPKLAIYILVTYKLAYSSDIRFFMNTFSKVCMKAIILFGQTKFN